jgi:hypothetical protein
MRQEIRDRELQEANQKTVAETAESPVVSSNPPQVENISARPKKKKINREMQDPDPVRVLFKVPKRRPKKRKEFSL